MANRATPFTFIETLSGNISAATYFDNNINAAFSALNDASLGYCNAQASDTGGVNSYIVASPFGQASAYNPGMLVAFIPANTNTSSSVISVDGLTAQTILDASGNSLGSSPGAIQAGQLTVLIYISGAFRLIYPAQRGLLFAKPSITGPGTTTIQCAGYTQVMITADTSLDSGSATYTLQLLGLTFGAKIDVLWIPRGSGQTLKFSSTCTDQDGSNITPISTYDSVDGTINLIVGGFSGVANYAVFTGALGNSAVTNVSQIRFVDGWS